MEDRWCGSKQHQHGITSITGESGSDLLLIALLRHQRECHGLGGHWLRRGRFSRRLGWRILTRDSLHGQGDIEYPLTLKAPGVHALDHHFLKFTIEVGLDFWITLLFLARDDNMLVLEIAFVVRFGVRTGCL